MARRATNKQLPGAGAGVGTKFTVVVSGSRHWDNVACVDSALASARKVAGPDATITLHHGACKGLDKLAARRARGLGWRVKRHRADWKGQGKRAGPIRNTAMLKAAKPDLVILFHPNIDAGSKGTKDLRNKASALFKRRKRGRMWTYTGEKGPKRGRAATTDL